MARNRGLDAATGDYVMFVDSDDWVPSDCLVKFLRVAEESRAPIVVSDSYLKDRRPRDRLRHPKWMRKSPALASMVLNRRLRSTVCNKLYRADVLKGRRFVEGICFEDWPFLVDVFAEQKDFALVHEPMYVYYTNAGVESTVHSKFSQRKVCGYLAGIRHVLGRFRNHADEAIVLRRAGMAAAMLVNQAYRSGELELAAAAVRGLDDIFVEFQDVSRTLPFKSRIRLWLLRRRTVNRRCLVATSCRLSVVTATYNVLSSGGREALLSCVKSVAALPIDHEHVIIDGASTDGTVDCLRELAIEFPSLKVLSEPDCGIYDALNKGLCVARGEYFYVLGADDRILDPARFAACVRKAESKDLDMVVARVAEQGSRRVRPVKLLSCCQEARRNSYCHQGAIVRTALEKECPFDTRYRISADYKQLLTLHWKGAKVGFCSQPIASFGEGGVFSTDNEGRARELLEIPKDVYALTDREYAKFEKTGFLPFRVVRHLMSNGSCFSWLMGVDLALSYVARKHKDVLQIGLALIRFSGKL